MDIDPFGTGLILFSTKDLLLKILGPTCDFAGTGLKIFFEGRAESLKRIVSRTHQKLGSRIEKPGAVPVRVWKRILEEGTLSTGDLFVEYYSGLLASSRSETGRDDRVLPLLNLLQSMSTYQIRMHYIFYYQLHVAFRGREINILEAQKAQKTIAFISFDDWEQSMNFDLTEDPNLIATHSLYWLVDSGLLSQNTSFGTKDFLNQCNPNLMLDRDGFVIAPSPKGAELFLAIQGFSNCQPGALFTCPQIEPCSDLVIHGQATPCCQE